MNRRDLMLLATGIAASIGLMAADRQDSKPVVIRMLLFQSVASEGRPGLAEAEAYPVTSRPGTAALREASKRSENAVSAAAIEALFDVYGLTAVDQLFYQEADGKPKSPVDGVVIGRSITYSIRLTPKESPAGTIGVWAVIGKGRTNPEMPMASGARPIIERDFDLGLDEPVLCALPSPEGDYYLLIWASAGTPRPASLTPAPEPIAFVPPPPVRSQVRPAFPEELRRRNLGGTIGFKLTIDPKGAVARVDIERPLHAYLNYAAVMALRQWTFDPVAIKGKPVPVSFRMEYEFDRRSYTDKEEVGPAPQGELASVLAQAAAYCEKLAGILSGFVCEETIQETHFDLAGGRTTRVLVVGERANIREADRAEADRLSTRDPINQGRIGDSRIGEGRILYKSVFETFDPRRDKRVKYLCDYQIFRKEGVVQEHRTILKENGKKPSDPAKTLGDRRFSALGSFFAPLRILSSGRQPKFAYFLAGEQKVAGRKALTLLVTPKSGDQDGILGAQVWIDKETRQVLKCEIEGVPLDGQEDILNECARLNVPVQFLTSHEYKAEKDGVLYPWRSDVEAAYPGWQGLEPSPRLKIALAYDKYRFFSVATEHEVIR